MRTWLAPFAAAAAVASAASAVAATTAAATTAGDQALAQAEAMWAKLSTYSCTIDAHEVQGTATQDRTYDMWFQRQPIMTRMDITGGDGKGSAVVWDGSDHVYGHKGGFLSMFKKHLPLHDPQATSLRGATVADASFGALLTHIEGLKGATIDATADARATELDVTVTDPSADQGVTRERLMLGQDGVPVEYDQWEGQTQVKRVEYSDIVLNVHLPDAIFTL